MASPLHNSRDVVLGTRPRILVVSLLVLVCDFSNSVKCPCNVTYDSVTLIFTFLIIIIIIIIIIILAVAVLVLVLVLVPRILMWTNSVNHFLDVERNS